MKESNKNSKNLNRLKNTLDVFTLGLLEYITKYKLILLTILLLWIKTYIVMKFVFNLDIENKAQEIILFISPLSFSLIFYGLLMLFVINRFKNSIILLSSFFFSLVLYGNVMFYRFYSDFVTVPVLMQTNNMSDLGSSVFGLMKLTDIFYFIDVLLIFILIRRFNHSMVGFKIRNSISLIILGMLVFFINLSMSEVQRPELLTRTFDREILVKNLGIYNYHIYDIYMQSKTNAQKAMAEENDIEEVENYIGAKSSYVNEELKGIAKDRNVVFIALESLQSAFVKESLEGEEITPFLNSLIKDSYYFSNFYHQTAQGKSSDSEFIIDTSWYPLGRGSVYFTHASNTYKGLPLILQNHGYSTNVFHANNKSFWNRDMMYVSMGYNKYYDIASYDVNEENSVGWGLKDIEFFNQSIKYLKELDEPYFSKFITLTNHFPFDLDEEDMVIKPWDSNSNTLNKYFTTVNYMDRSIESLFNELKANDLYEDTIFVLYGDHYGISENHNKAMAKFLNKKKLNDYDVAELQKVPLIIHIPGVTDNGNGKEIKTYGAQVDLKPTILNLLGIETKDLQFGSDLLSDKNDNIAVFRDGRVVSDKFVYAGNACYIRPEYALEYFREEELVSLDEKNKLDYKSLYNDYLKDNSINVLESFIEGNSVKEDIEESADDKNSEQEDSEKKDNQEETSVNESEIETIDSLKEAETEIESLIESVINSLEKSDLIHEDDLSKIESLLNELLVVEEPINLLSYEEFISINKEKLKTGYKIDNDNCTELINFSKQELKYSDKLIYGDLMRFFDYLDDVNTDEIENEKLIEDLMEKQTEKLKINNNNSN